MSAFDPKRTLRTIVARSVSTFARRDVFDPILRHRFIGGKRQADAYRRRLPDERRRRPEELLAELEIRCILAEPREDDVEVSFGVCCACRRINRNDRAPRAF